MSRTLATILAAAALGATLTAPGGPAAAQQPPAAGIKLPPAPHEGAMSLEAALWARRSTRGFTHDSISLADLGQLLWAADGVNRPNSHRTAPSAMATYALELYVVASRVRDLPAGVYHYQVAAHELERQASGDRMPDLVASAARSAWIADAAAVVVFAGAFDRAAGRMRERTERYIAIEVGAAAQNLYLQAAALGLGTTFVASVQDSAVARIARLGSGEQPMGIMPLGRPR